MANHESSNHESADEVVEEDSTPASRQTLAEENHEEAQRLLRRFEQRRQWLGSGSPIGRIGLIDGVGVNFAEKDLRPPADKPGRES
ncbi:MAG TPA: hypothetical protein VFW90_01100 [Candidatus Saccharimonadales bacterium]|nr:hypothetical protein [Candidatus Saccharimonadales bacterium]